MRRGRGGRTHVVRRGALQRGQRRLRLEQRAPVGPERRRGRGRRGDVWRRVLQGLPPGRGRARPRGARLRGLRGLLLQRLGRLPRRARHHDDKRGVHRLRRRAPAGDGGAGLRGAPAAEARADAAGNGRQHARQARGGNNRRGASRRGFYGVQGCGRPSPCADGGGRTGPDGRGRDAGAGGRRRRAARGRGPDAGRPFARGAGRWGACAAGRREPDRPGAHVRGGRCGRRLKRGLRGGGRPRRKAVLHGTSGGREGARRPAPRDARLDGLRRAVPLREV